ncbi:DUF3795 domain-containing protein [Myxococcota bacterium]
MADCLESYCGIYCGACSVLRYASTGHSDAFLNSCSSLPKNALVCRGCKSGTLYAGCRTCEVRECASQRGVTQCAQCAEYPCRTYKRLRSTRRILPHLWERAPNLAAITQHGMDAWLAEQEKRWSCPECGTRFSWYTAACTQCGRSLASEAYTLSGVRKLLCQWLLPMLYRRGKAKEESA